MLFDPYSDGPFKAAPAAAARTKSPSEGVAAAPGTGGSVRTDRAPEGQGGHRGHRLDAAQLLEGLNPQQEEAV
jgi:DNA helicase-2/ATP-dependent DNA helicase PcrA